MPRKPLITLALCASLYATHARAQGCQPPPIVANARTSNIFTPEQEMIFGELTLQNMAGEVRLIRDPQLLAYVESIGARLARHLPPTGLRFQFHLIDIPEANAFNTPGGHVFLSRKLVGFVTSEDELAGVIAHELGHAVVRHGATDISEALRKILNVTALGDRRDITEKYNLLIERARTKRISRGRGHANDQQLEADRIGVHALAAAGYNPAAFSSFFDRLTENEGKTGSWFSDFFGTIPPEQKRMRELVRATEQMPASCREGRTPAPTETFLKWQAEVVSYREAGRREEVPGLLWRRELQPKLRSDISHFAFSRDGRLLLAQDDFAVTVVERAERPRVLFQIPAEGAGEAVFTPDGQSVVFTTESLRYERWSVADRKPVELRELVVRRDCWEHALSPDGNFLACVDNSASVNVLDVKTGRKVWEKKEFYQLSFWEYFLWVLAGRQTQESFFGSFFRIEFSPDSRYVMFSRSDRFRYRLITDYFTDETENTALALDLTTLKTADLGGDLRKIASRPYLFLDSERVLGMPSRKKVEDAGVFAFPSGRRLQKFSLSALEVKRTANPDYVVIKPLANTRMGVFDVKRGFIASGMNKSDATMWGNLMAYESANGQVLLREMNYNEAEKKFDSKDVGTVEVPVGPLGRLSVAGVSNNFNWLVISSKSRGGLWSLQTGERKLHVRGFRGGLVADDGVGVGDFPAQEPIPHSLVLLNPQDGSVVPVRELPTSGARQYGRFVLLRTSLKAAEKEKKKEDGKQTAAAALPPSLDDEEADGLGLSRDVRFELKDFIQDKVIWSRDFRKEAPEYTFDDYTGRLIFYYGLGGEAGKARLKESPELQARAEALGNKSDDYLVEVVDAFAQKTVGAMLLETGRGSFDVGGGLSEGDWLVVRDTEGRVLVYSIKTGELRHRFFGRHAAVNPRTSQIAVENLPGEVTLYDLETGERLADFRFQGSAAFVRFNLEGTRLFLLSDAQTAYAIDLAKLKGN